MEDVEMIHSLCIAHNPHLFFTSSYQYRRTCFSHSEDDEKENAELIRKQNIEAHADAVKTLMRHVQDVSDSVRAVAEEKGGTFSVELISAVQVLKGISEGIAELVEVLRRRA
jgi:hypothetical protein